MIFGKHINRYYLRFGWMLILGLAALVMVESLVEQLKQVQDCIDYIDWKQNFYDDVLSGKTKYYSNLINTEE